MIVTVAKKGVCAALPPDQQAWFMRNQLNTHTYMRTQTHMHTPVMAVRLITKRSFIRQFLSCTLVCLVLLCVYYATRWC